MEKVIIFGVGGYYRQFIDNIEKNYEVEAIVDNQYDKYEDMKVYPVSYIENEDYDKIIITPVKYTAMLEQLLEMKVPEEKIIILVNEPVLCAHHMIGNTYWGQHGEDLVLGAIFSRLQIQRPSYIDLGTNMVAMDSNTIFLYLQGCRGINIEANPLLVESIRNVKPEDVTLNVGVVTREGTLPFYLMDETSGLNTFSEEEMKKNGGKPKKVIDIPVCTLKSIVDEYCPDGFPDFLDCDIEGLDYEVLADYDFLSDGPKVICVEVRPNEIEKFDVMLDEKGYYRFCRIGENNIYVQKKYSKVVSHM